MKPSDYQTLVDDLIRDEGIRLVVYEDTMGMQTIGVGRQLTTNGITHEEAMTLLAHDIERVLLEARTFTWYATLDPVRQRVILNLLFNLGLTRFKLFRHFIAAMAQRNYEKAAVELLASKWAGQVGKRSERLAAEMRTGDE